MTTRARDAVMSFSEDGTKTWGQFAADVAQLRPRIARASHVCNALPDRYDFMVGLAAALLNEQVTVLPNAPAVGAVAGSIEGAGEPLILGGDRQHDDLAWRLPSLEAAAAQVDPAETIGALEASTTEIHVFTSGTTTQPKRNLKTWAMLKGGAVVTQVILERLGVEPGSCALLGTTPHQHMYGLEATVFAGLGLGWASHRRTVFFPADLEAALGAARESEYPRLVLITSPAHLKFLEQAILASPEICGIVSATAPLSLAQAERLEARGDLPVMEIYGSTETGSLAIRRTVEGDLWEPVVGFTLEPTDEGCLARAPHMPAAVPLGDSVTPLADGRFTLLGRVGDMVSIRGKKTTLATLNAVLAETPGLVDGAVYHTKRAGGDLLAIAAVRDTAGPLTEAELRSAIRRHFHRHLDPVFAARKIVFVDALPRSGTGKIPDAALSALFR